MDDFQVPTDDLQKAAKEFAEVGKECLVLIERLESATSELETKWSSAAQQMFFKHYKEWHQHMQGFVELLNQISKEMYAIADRFEQADK